MFLDERQQIWEWKGCTDFCLLKQYLDGHDIGPVLDDRVALGFNLVRVLGMMTYIDRLVPTEIRNYYDRLSAFADVLAEWKLRMEYVALADVQTLLSFDAVGHAQQAADVLRSKWNVVYELVNEYGYNGGLPSVSKPTGLLLSSHGSGGGDEDPALPPWDFLTFHPGRSADWPRKMKASREYSDRFNKPCVSDEPIGAAEQEIPGKRSTSTNDFFDAGACAALQTAGATFHSDNGIQSQLFEPTTRTCAAAFLAGMNSIPPVAQTWKYTRGGLSECPVVHDDALAVRTFVQYTDQEAWGVAIQPKPKWRLTPLRGRLTEVLGDRGNVFHLTF